MTKYQFGRTITRLPYSRRDFGNEAREEFPEGTDGDRQYIEVRRLGDRSYLKYFIEEMFTGYEGRGKLQSTALVTGTLGTGKTCYLAFLGWNIKDIFGMPVSTDFGSLKREVFGDYEYLDDLSIVDELIKVSNTEKERIRKKLSAEAADALLKENKSKLYKHVVLWDEIYKKASNRRGMDNINLLVGDIMKQQRHFKSLFIFAAPAQNEIDGKIVRQYVNVEVTGVKLTPNIRIPLDAPPELVRENWTLYDHYNNITLVKEPYLLYREPFHRLFDSASLPTIRQKLTADDMNRTVKEVYCPECNKKYPTDSLFCGKCGVTLKSATICSNEECGVYILPKYKYCLKCGKANENYTEPPNKMDTVKEEAII
jgi:hypothetical protein